MTFMYRIEDAPQELQDGILHYFPSTEWNNAASIARLESGWNAFALGDTTSDDTPCGSWLRSVDGVDVFAERSVGYFQINSCNYPTWEWQRLYNADHNCGTAHMIWMSQGWQAWYFSAKQLGLI